MSKLTKEQIEKPFSTHEETLKSLWVLDGFRDMMESLIECTRREIADNMIVDIETLRVRQGELYTYKKILARAKRAYELIKPIKKDAT